MKRVPIFVCVLPFLLLGCAGMFGTVAGEHWRISIADPGQQLEANSVEKISQVLTDRLHLVVIGTAREPDGGSIYMADAFPGPTLTIKVQVLISKSQVVVGSQCIGKSADGEKRQAVMAQQILSILKEMYPRSVAVPFKAYRTIYDELSQTSDSNFGNRS